MMQRILAFDVGERRIGVAVSDPLGFSAQGLETYTRTDSLDETVSHLLEIAERYRPVKLVFGMPRNMNGSYGAQAEAIRTFADAVLARWDGEYDFYDERLTTMSVQRMLIDADVRRDKRKKVVDKLAAVVILQNYLDAHAVR